MPFEKRKTKPQKQAFSALLDQKLQKKRIMNRKFPLFSHRSNSNLNDTTTFNFQFSTFNYFDTLKGNRFFLLPLHYGAGCAPTQDQFLVRDARMAWASGLSKVKPALDTRTIFSPKLV